MLYGLQILGTDFFKCTAGIFAEVQCSDFEIKSVVKISDIFTVFLSSKFAEEINLSLSP